MLLEFSISPMDKGPSVGAFVARALDIVDRSGVSYRLNPMGTVLEGSWDEVMGVVKRCLEDLERDCDRISVTMKLDHRKGKSGALSAKVEGVERALGRKLKT
ncbi:MAG: MTH1187 family thiamine-binding protein [Deltaproteobacteria bacterium]|nr:MTH1187 family thiamine-binding protein [Deltaproteobacteria bacterium]